MHQSIDGIGILNETTSTSKSYVPANRLNNNFMSPIDFTGPSTSSFVPSDSQEHDVFTITELSSADETIDALQQNEQKFQQELTSITKYPQFESYVKTIVNNEMENWMQKYAIGQQNR